MNPTLILNLAVRNLLILAAFGVSHVYLAAVNKAAYNQDNTKPCTTDDCLRSATTFVESMNKSVDPCEDFYLYACGNYGNSHRIPKTSLSNDRFAEVHASMTELIRDFMEKADSNTEPFSVSQARLLYRSCMATDEMDAVGLLPLLKILDQVGLPYLGFWPKKSKKKSSDLSSTLANIKKYLNLEYLFTTTVEPDPKNRTINRIALSKPNDSNDMFSAHKISDRMRKKSSRIIRETLVSEDNVKYENDETEDTEYIRSYGKYFKSVWKEIYNSQSENVHLTNNELLYRILEILNFTNQFTQIKNKVYDTDGQLPLKVTVDVLQFITNNITNGTAGGFSNESTIDWRQYFTILFADVKNVTLNFETDIIQISNIEYLESLFKMLVEYPKSQIVLNLWWDVVTKILPYTTNQMRFIQDRFLYETSGIENNPSRSLYCANAVNTMMGMAVSYLLVDMKSLDRDVNTMIEMINNIRWAFEKIVQDLDWMDDTTKKRTLYKSQQIKTFIGYPELVNDTSQLDDYYSEYEVIENDYFGNVIRCVQQDVDNNLMLLRELNNYTTTDSWASNPLEVNAFNWLQANAITVPAGIIQFPFFGHDLQVLNYGNLGCILGHELTHGFDNTGRLFDHDGNENMWWSNRTIEEYEKRSHCFINHYESYLVPGLEEKVNGKLTLDENIADNGGLREAYLAYKKFVKDHGEEPRLAGLEHFSNDQIFFLAFASSWCEASSIDSLSYSLLNEHSPNYVRVLAGLTNSKEFSEVWKCAKGTRMNPQEEKCKIW